MPTSSLIPFPRFTTQDTTNLPHLFPRDLAIWKKYLLTPDAQTYLGFDYDIKVGQAQIDLLELNTAENRLKAGTLAKRIDVVAFLSPSTVDLVEVKSENVPAALGQLITYKQLFKDTYPQFLTVSLLLVTDHNDPDLLPILKLHNVKLIYIP